MANQWFNQHRKGGLVYTVVLLEAEAAAAISDFGLFQRRQRVFHGQNFRFVGYQLTTFSLLGTAAARR
jgi:hypothetical protein